MWQVAECVWAGLWGRFRASTPRRRSPLLGSAPGSPPPPPAQHQTDRTRHDANRTMRIDASQPGAGREDAEGGGRDAPASRLWWRRRCRFRRASGQRPRGWQSPRIAARRGPGETARRRPRRRGRCPRTAPRRTPLRTAPPAPRNPPHPSASAPPEKTHICGKISSDSQQMRSGSWWRMCRTCYGSIPMEIRGEKEARASFTKDTGVLLRCFGLALARSRKPQVRGKSPRPKN